MITLRKIDQIGVIVINRVEQRNAVDRETANALVTAVREVEEDNDLLVGILAGSNGVFCAGADLKAFGNENKQNRLEIEGDAPMGPSRMLTRKPFIAAIAGFAVAGGLELALWCDLRVVEKDAVLGVFCRRWGVPLIDGGTVRLPRLIGLSRALDLVLTGRAVHADEALAIGLANRVCEPGSSLDVALELARDLCKLPQECMRNDRISCYESLAMPLNDALRHEFQLGLKSLPHARAGVAKFVAGMGRSGAKL